MNELVTAPLSAEGTVAHSTFRVERYYPHTPARVFRAFSDKDTVRRWRIEYEGCEVYEFAFDFRVGGAEVSRFSFGGAIESSVTENFGPCAVVLVIFRGEALQCVGLTGENRAEIDDRDLRRRRGVILDAEFLEQIHRAPPGR